MFAILLGCENNLPSKSAENRYDCTGKYIEYKKIHIVQPKAIFHTKVLQDGPTPKIGAMRAKYLWVGSMSPNKETFASDPAHMKNNASEKKKGSNVAADFWYLGGVKKSLFRR